MNHHPPARKYRAQIQINKKTIHLGYFDNPHDAAIEYDKAAKRHFGTTAKLNYK